MKTMITYLAIILMIVLHELGHFIAGRICGVPIAEFSIGFGRPLLQRTGKTGTIYSLRLIPFGGYCAFDRGDTTGAVDHALDELPVLKRLFVFAAGPLVNIFSCVILCFIICFGTGVPCPTTVVDSIQPGYSAETVLQKGDVIVSVNGTDVATADAMAKEMSKLDEDDVVLGVKRDGEIVEKIVAPKMYRDGKTYTLGIIFKQDNARLPFVSSVKDSFIITWNLLVTIVTTLAGLFTGTVSLKSLTSIVGASDTIAAYASVSQLPTYLLYCGYISLNLGVMNLLPIPALDGFKIFTGMIEGITKKKIPERIEERMITVSMALLFGFAGVMILRDLFYMAA